METQAEATLVADAQEGAGARPGTKRGSQAWRDSITRRGYDTHRRHNPHATRYALPPHDHAPARARCRTEARRPPAWPLKMTITLR